MVINNLGGNKLDYYLRRGLEYNAVGRLRRRDAGNSTVTVHLASTVPDRAYRTTSPGLNGGCALYGGCAHHDPARTNATSVRLLATTGATLKGIHRQRLNGQRVPVFRGMERGHPIFEVQLGLQRARPTVVRYELTEPTAAGAPRVPIQPLTDSVTPVVAVPQCTG